MIQLVSVSALFALMHLPLLGVAASQSCTLDPKILARTTISSEQETKDWKNYRRLLENRYRARTEELCERIGEGRADWNCGKDAEVFGEGFELETHEYAGSDPLKRDASELASWKDSADGRKKVEVFVAGHNLRQAYLFESAMPEPLELESSVYRSPFEVTVFFGKDAEPLPASKLDGQGFYFAQVPADTKDSPDLLSPQKFDDALNLAVNQFDIALKYAQLNRWLSGTRPCEGIIPFVEEIDLVLDGTDDSIKETVLAKKLCSRMSEALLAASSSVPLRCAGSSQ